jgi:hypothetical protein
MIENVGARPAERLLALEVRSRKMGFVVFEGPTRLLDFGIRGFSQPTQRLHEVVAKRIKPLLFRYSPSAIVMRRDNHYALQHPARLRIATDAIRKEGNRCGIEFRLLKTKSRNNFFVQVGCDAKHQVAQLIAKQFNELSPMLQPQRRPWHSESYHTVIFDAVATGLCALADEFTPDEVMELKAT